jgi:hypothetical protein
MSKKCCGQNFAAEMFRTKSALKISGTSLPRSLADSASPPSVIVNTKTAHDHCISRRRLGEDYSERMADEHLDS